MEEYQNKKAPWLVENLKSWIGIIGGSVGIFSAIFTAIFFLKPPKHDMEIFVPIVKIEDSKVTLAMIFDNDGDINEVVTYIGLYFVDNYGNPDYENYILLAEDQDIFLVNSNTSLKKVLFSNIDFNKAYLNDSLQFNSHYTIVLYFQLISRENTFTNLKLPVGEIILSQHPEDGSISGDIIIKSPSGEVDFSIQKPMITLTSFPRQTIYDPAELKDI